MESNDEAPTAETQGRTRRVYYGSALTGLPPGILVEDLRPDAAERFWDAMADSVQRDIDRRA